MEFWNFLKQHKKRPVKSGKEFNSLNKVKFVLLTEEKEQEIPQREHVLLIPKSKGEFNGVTQEIWTYAPDRYDEMYWPTPHRPNLESSYEELRKGIEVVFRQKRFNDKRPKLISLVEESYSAYKMGNRDKGMEIISQIQIMMGKMK